MVWAFLEHHNEQLRLVAVVPGDPNAATLRVREAFSEAGAWITDVHFFSGLQTTLAFEVAPGFVRPLVAALEHAGLVFDETSRAAVERAAGIPGESLEGTLGVIFAEGDPDVRREVPAVPG